MLIKGRNKKDINVIIVQSIIVIGLLSFLGILTFYTSDYKYILTVNSIFIISAFLAVIFNYLLKDKYRVKSMRNLSEFREEIEN